MRHISNRHAIIIAKTMIFDLGFAVRNPLKKAMEQEQAENGECHKKGYACMLHENKSK